MHFNLTDEQAMVRESAERLVRKYCVLERRRELIAQGAGFDAELWTQMVELGWPALSIPESEGGLGGSMTDTALLMIELGRGMCSEPLVSSAVLGARLLADSGWAGRGEWVEAAAYGGRQLAFAHLEPGERAEVGMPRATTLMAHDGGCRLSGSKLLVLNAEQADAWLVTASAPEGAELYILLVPKGQAGVELHGYPLIDGNRAADITFNDVELGQDCIVARGSAAETLLSDALARASVANLAAAVGSMEACLALCSDYLKVRSQFGQAIGRFQALQHMMADMLVAAHNARSLLYSVLAVFDGDPQVRSAAISAAKIAVGQAGLLVSRSGIQLHGGYGLTDEFAIGHHHRFLYRLEKSQGDTNAHLRSLAGVLLDEPLDNSEQALRSAGGWV